MTIYSRGDVVYIPFKFTGSERLKSRPGVVVSTAAYNESRSDVVIAGITSNLAREQYVGQMLLNDWAASGLSKPSAVSGIIQTIRESQIKQRLGVLSESDQERLDDILRQVIGV